MKRRGNFELTTDGDQQKPKAGCGGPRAELIRRKFFPWMICVLLIVSILMSAVTLGIVANLKNSEMINGLLVKLQSDVARLIEKNSEMTNDSLAELTDEVSHLRKGIMPIQLLNKWRPFKENEYYFTSIRCPWSDAEKLCERKNSKLVVINSQEEQEYIRMNANCDRWIGLHDRAKDGTWRWVDGTDYASNVKFWASGEPNGTGGVDEDCALVGENGLWYARPCKTWLSLICEKRAD